MNFRRNNDCIYTFMQPSKQIQIGIEMEEKKEREIDNLYILSLEVMKKVGHAELGSMWERWKLTEQAKSKPEKQEFGLGKKTSE